MTQETTISSTEVSFKYFLLKDKRNRTILALIATAIVIQFAVFKYYYPFASYIHGDSFSYIKAADQNLPINTYLIGYSKFLRLFSVFVKSDLALTAFQYTFIQGAAMFLLFSIFYFFKPSKFVQTILVTFATFNPLGLYLGNLVSSDAIFLGLSLIWFALLLRIIYSPTKSVLLWHAIIIFIAFTFRYNALIYPFCSTVVIGISRLSLIEKIKGIGIAIVLCLLFVFHSSFKYKQLTGYWQYSPFSGWQWANNAMYAYRNIDSAERKSVPPKFNDLNKMVCTYFDKTRNTNLFNLESILPSTVYMWSKGLPLYKYRDKIFINDSTATEFKKWASMGPFYKQYGLYIIKQYPKEYLKFFIWPNVTKYYAPPEEFLGVYNTGSNKVDTIAQKWFGYKSQMVTTRTRDLNINVLSFLPILSGIINIILITCLVGYTILSGWKKDNLSRHYIFIATLFWFINAIFSIITTPAALRFQSFPILMSCILTTYLMDWMIRYAKAADKNIYNDKDVQQKIITQVT